MPSEPRPAERTGSAMGQCQLSVQWSLRREKGEDGMKDCEGLFLDFNHHTFNPG